tara:strand:+ start:1965 stop:3665 length:1701 start_codon:yes stop_codon:yes gene_type:complete
MLFGFPVEEVRADAIVTNRSMKAPTIAEIFVETEAVRVELEIGFEDLEPFQNVLPAEILERLGKEAKPFPDRFGEFFLKDWVIQFDGEIAVPRLEMMEGKTRQLRDEFTGEALSMAEGEGESVLVVNLTYLITEAKPKSVTLSAPDGSAVGFVLYHQGLAVNDFRFMSGELTVDLDWGDPWYSKFGHPNFARQYDAPLQGFLYAEPFEVRKEIIARPLDLEEWIDLDLEGKETLDAADREVILAKVAAFLETRCPVTIDGEPVEGTLDRIHFVRRSLRQTSVVTPEDDPIPLLSSMVGAIIVYPTAGLPKEAAMTWDLFTERTPKMVGRATDEAGGLPITVTPEDPEFVWKNYLKNPTVPGLVEISNPPVAKSWSLPIVVILAFIPILYLARKTRAPRQRGVALVALVVLVGLSFVPVLRVKVLRPGGSPSIQSEEEAGKVVEGLLTNIYRAFDYRDESTIYDSLAQSVEGDLLSDVYLEVQQALQLENQGGARTKVKEITLEASELKSEEERGFVSRANWMVTGSVGHWGHTHQRINRYEAEVTVSPVDGHWKVTGLQLLNEERL